MEEFPSKISTQTSTPDNPNTGTISWRFISLDVGFVKSIVGILMVLEIVLGLLVWALIADSHYHHIPAYGWVMFVAVFCWLATLILFVIFLLQLQLKLSIIPWPIVLLAYNIAAATLYITGFIACAASVQAVQWFSGDYNKRAAASFFACLVMLAYGASSFFSIKVWRGDNSNAATSQASGTNNA